MMPSRNKSEPSTALAARLESSQWSTSAPEVLPDPRSDSVCAVVLPLPDILTQIPITDMNAVTVPGAVAGWFKTHSEFGSGKLSMAEILAPAIRLAEDGVPTHEINSSMVSEMIPRDSWPALTFQWTRSAKLLNTASKGGAEWVVLRCDRARIQYKELTLSACCFRTG